MTPPVTLTFARSAYEQLQAHLFPGDGNEAAAILLCGRRAGERRHRLLVREVHEIPHAACLRKPRRITWPTALIEHLLERAEAEGLSVVKVHSHPTGFPDFSATDDEADRAFLPAVRGWIEAEVPHGSAIMLPDGQMFGRVLTSDGLAPISCINLVGDDLRFWYGPRGGKEADIPDFAASHAQIFGEGTFERLQRLSVAVVGCSGTGSPVVEQLVRLGVGEIVLVDDDISEKRNVNRILNSTMQDAADKRRKTEVIGDAMERIGIGTSIVRIGRNLWDPDTVREVAQCDIVFGCMDTIDGRYLLNLLASYYLLAYFDIGIRLDAVPDGADKGRIREVCGTVHYLQPGKSSLLTRGLFTLAEVASAGLRRTDPDAHAAQLKEGYVAGVEVHRPAVISVNMFAASLAVNELLARLHPYREDANGCYAAVTFSLASMELFGEPEADRCAIIAPHAGKGDVRPLLRMVELSERRAP